MMERYPVSSTSSSENECNSKSPFNNYFEDLNYPVYPFVGRYPFVYNIVEQDRCTRRGRIGKKKANCFVKAFRWYTQELPPPQNESSTTRAKVAGFAAWLDKKYDEFLCDSKCGSDCFQLQSAQYCVTSSDNTVERDNITSRKSKKFQRLKSPWKRKKQLCKNTERCSLRETCSFKFLLKPEDVSTSSQCCKKISCDKRSDATYVTSRIAIEKNVTQKSISATCIRFEKPINVTNYETNKDVNRQNTKIIDRFEEKDQNTDNELIEKSSSKSVSCVCSHEISIISKKGMQATSFADVSVVTASRSPKDNKEISNLRKRHSKRTVSCQCSLYELPSIYNKSEPSPKDNKVDCMYQNPHVPCCQCNIQPKHQDFATTKDVDSCVTNPLRKHPKKLKEIIIQTSNHSIIFEKDQLFVNVLCGPVKK